jgi:ATP-binding protein involved in chromosome partitioning
MLRAARALRAAVPLAAPPSFARPLAHAADPYGTRAPLPGVAHCVAVASGKGGVGKSTTAVNLAVAATALGLRVGLLDADVYGPSLPLLMGLPAGVPPRLDAQKRMVPPTPHGVATISMGLLLKGAR